jgi:predicted RNase H-like HicB family nuclease
MLSNEPIMKSEFTAVLKQVSEGWIGWIEEVPGVNCQEPTYEALIDSLKVTLNEALEFNRQEALAAAGQGYREEPIVL